jgi:superfamily II DNA/RNA helicase
MAKFRSGELNLLMATNVGSEGEGAGVAASVRPHLIALMLLAAHACLRHQQPCPDSLLLALCTGMDFRQCSLAVAFDPPANMIHYIQCRGRARKAGSTYIIMYNASDRPQQCRVQALPGWVAPHGAAGVCMRGQQVVGGGTHIDPVR